MWSCLSRLNDTGSPGVVSLFLFRPRVFAFRFNGYIHLVVFFFTLAALDLHLCTGQIIGTPSESYAQAS